MSFMPAIAPQDHSLRRRETISPRRETKMRRKNFALRRHTRDRRGPGRYRGRRRIVVLSRAQAAAERPLDEALGVPHGLHLCEGRDALEARSEPA